MMNCKNKVLATLMKRLPVTEVVMVKTSDENEDGSNCPF